MTYCLNYLLRYLQKINGNELKNLVKTFKSISKALMQGAKKSKGVI